MSKKGSRLKLIRESLELNQVDFATELGVTQPHLSSMEKETRNISASIIEIISIRYPEINLDWLIHGRGPMTFSSAYIVHCPENEGVSEPNLSPNYAKRRDFVDYAENRVIYIPGGIMGGVAIPKDDEWDELETLTIPGWRGGGLCFQVKGDSMSPVLEDGDYIITKYPSTPLAEVKTGAAYAINSRYSGISVKHISLDESYIICTSANYLSYDQYTIPIDDVLGVYEVRMRITSRLTGPHIHPATEARLNKIEQFLTHIHPDWDTKR